MKVVNRGIEVIHTDVTIMDDEIDQFLLDVGNPTVIVRSAVCLPTRHPIVLSLGEPDDHVLEIVLWKGNVPYNLAYLDGSEIKDRKLTRDEFRFFIKERANKIIFPSLVFPRLGGY